MRLDRARGFVLDIDGTLVHREGHTAHVAPGAVEVLKRIRASGRPFVLFTNGSHITPAGFAQGLREVGLPVADDQVLTPLCSVQAYLERGLRGASMLPFVTEAAHDFLAGAGLNLVDGDGDGDGDGERDGERADVVFVAHTDEIDFPKLERAARSVIAGARLLTGSYVAAYAGANGPILSRGAMITAAIAKASSRRPTIVGKPSHAAVREIRKRLGVPTEEIAVIGDDLFMDIPLGHLGGSQTVFVKSGISASLDLSKLPARNRPDAAVDGVGELLELL